MYRQCKCKNAAERIEHNTTRHDTMPTQVQSMRSTQIQRITDHWAWSCTQCNYGVSTSTYRVDRPTGWAKLNGANLHFCL